MNITVKSDSQEKLFTEIQANGRVKGYDVQIRKKNGEIADLLFSAELVELESETIIVSMAQDITERKKAEKALRENHSRHAAMIANIGDVIAIMEPDGILKYQSPNIEKYFGWKPEEIIGTSSFEKVHPEDIIRIQKEFSKVLEKESPAVIEFRHKCKDGTYKWIELTAANHINDPAINGVLINYHDISERKRTEEILKESEEKYRSIYDNSLLGIFRSNPAGKVLTANRAFLEIYNFKNLEELNKTPAQDYYVNIEDRNVMIEILKKEGIVKNHVTKERKRDNSEICVKTNYIATKDEKGNILFIDGVLEDITLQIKAEEKIRELSQAVEQSPAAIVITNLNGEIEYTNPKFTQITDYTAKEALGKNPRILKSGETSREEYLELWETISSGKEWRGVFRNRKKNGECFWESASISAIKNKNGEITQYLAIKEDITERKQIELELIKAKEKAEESDRLKSAFLANMSHEIRTPMNGILGFSDLLKEPNLSGEKQQKYIGIIEKSGARMLNIINDIISISKIESGLMEVNIQESNINAQIEYIYTFFKPEIEAKGMQFSFRNSLPSKEALLKTDSEKVYAILTNLVKNAIKYSEKGSIEMGVSTSSTTKDKADTSTTLSAQVEFYVKDTGIGIPEDRQKAIFDRFVQADIADKMARQGAGLGLSISKAFVEMLGGKIWVESEEGIGSTFYFTLPYTSEKMKEKNAKNEDLTPAEMSPVKKLKILIAEDDETSEMLISIAVQKFGKEIISVRTGTEAVAACQNNPDINLVLMDIEMPEMDGYEATRQIRKFNKDIIIIAQTAYALEGEKAKAMAAGCDDYIAKPIRADELKQMIIKYLKKQ